MIVFIDDIFIYTTSEIDHTNHLRIVLQVLKDNRLFRKFSKRELLLKSVALIGQIFFDKGIEADLRKTDVVKSLLRTLNTTNI